MLKCGLTGIALCGIADRGSIVLLRVGYLNQTASKLNKKKKHLNIGYVVRPNAPKAGRWQQSSA